MTTTTYKIEQITFSQKLIELANQYGKKIAIVDEEKRYTYNEFLINVKKLASSYLEIGIKKGDHVLLQVPNTAGCIFTMFALATIGAVPIMGLPSQREADFKNIIEITKPVAYIAADNYLGYDFTKLASRLQEEFPSIKIVVFDGEEAHGHYTINDLMKKGSTEIQSNTDASEIVFLLLSGGTTNTPKLIPRTHADYLYNASMSAKRCRMDEDTVYLTALPIEHNFTLSSPGILGTFVSGGKVVLAKTSSPDELLDLIAGEKVTHTGMVPAIANLCMDMLEWWDDGDLSSWKVLQVGGSVLEESVAKRIMETMPCKLQQVFGTAEGLICMTDLDDPEEVILKYQGKPISELDELRIIDENGNYLQAGEYGELITKGPYTIHGYYKAEEANRKSFTEDGFYRTGDKAAILEDGNLSVAGRISEQINRGGEKIMPIEVETALCQHNDIKDAYVVGVKDEMYGHTTCGFILMEEESSSLDLITVNGFLKGLGLAQYKWLDDLIVVDGFPLTNVGKVNKKKLVEIAMEKKVGN